MRSQSTINLIFIYEISYIMKTKIRLIIVDDHPLIVHCYKIILADYIHTSLVVETALTLDDALVLIERNRQRPYDLLLLDISMPPSIRDASLISGEDLGKRIKELDLGTKIVVISALTDNFRLNCLLKSLNPEGFLVKTDLTAEILLEAITAVLRGNVYYSRAVSNLIRRKITLDIYIDDLDRKILYFLASGERMKNLPKYIPLSLPTIERRKKKLKVHFDMEEEGDGKLLQKAKELGFI